MKVIIFRFVVFFFICFQIEIKFWLKNMCFFYRKQIFS